MLSRSAEGLYWMGRYLERAQHLSRLLRMQTEALVDRPVNEIHFGWLRVYGSLHRQPPVGSLELLAQDDFTLADSYTLADDLTFEPTNPDSVWSGISNGRENARHVRHCISGELWTSLNLNLPLRVQKHHPTGHLAGLARRVSMRRWRRRSNTFSGVAAATMYRDEGWRFMQLGRFDGTGPALHLAMLHLPDRCRLLDRTRDEFAEADWTSLLHLSPRASRRITATYSIDRASRAIRCWTCWPPTPCCPTPSVQVAG